MSAKEQTEILADYIMTNILGERSQDEGAGRTAVRLLKRYRDALDRIMYELQPSFAKPSSNAYVIARNALLCVRGEGNNAA